MLGHVARHAPIDCLWRDTAWDGFESMAVGLSDTLDWNRTMGPSKRTAYVVAPSGGPSCRLKDAAYSPVTVDELAGRCADTSLVSELSLGAGRLFACSDMPPVLVSSLALPLPAGCLNGLWRAEVPPPGAVLRLLPALLPSSSCGKVPSSTPWEWQGKAAK